MLEKQTVYYTLANTYYTYVVPTYNNTLLVSGYTIML